MLSPLAKILAGAVVYAALASTVHAQVRSNVGGNNFGSPFGGSSYGIGQGSGFGLGNGAGAGFGVGGQQGGLQQGGLQQGGLQQGGLQQGPGGDRGFVGSDAQDAQSMFQNLNGRDRRRAMFDFALDSLNEMRDQRRRWQSRNRRPPPARVALIPDADMAPLAPTATADALTERITEVMTNRGVGAPRIEVAGRTVVLRGTVATEHDKLLAGKLAEIEPGVSEVDNQLTVETDPTP